MESRDRVSDHSWLSRTRTRLPHEVHTAIFDWVLALIAEAGLVKGGRIGVDASTMEANAALRSFVRRTRARVTGGCWSAWPGTAASRRPRPRTWRVSMLRGAADSSQTHPKNFWYIKPLFLRIDCNRPPATDIRVIE